MHLTPPIEDRESKPWLLLLFAKITAYIFHPLFIPTYIFLWLSNRFPIHFAGLLPQQLIIKYIQVFWMTAFFPAFAVFLLKQLKFIDSVYLRTQRERIIPYIITMFFYWWMFYLSRNTAFSNQPEVLKHFYLGIFFSTVLGLVINNFIKISLHAIAMASGFTIMFLSCIVYGVSYGLDLSIVILFTGLVCSARLVANHHHPVEIYAGLAVGVFTQLLAYWII